MTTMSDSAAARRFRLALDMYEFGEKMMRQRIKRENPNASAEELDTAIADWLKRRTGSPYGKGVGKPWKWSHESR